MRVLQLTWEFPPRIIGGIAPHVYDLSKALVRKKAAVHVTTCNFPGAREYENINGVHVYRFEAYAAGDSFIGWVLRMQKNMENKAADVVNSTGGVDIIHAHDWVAGVAGIALKHLFRKPLVATMHSTEYGRRAGLHDDFQRCIHEIESWFCRESWRVITCSHYMKGQVSWYFDLPEDKIDVAPNGVDLTKWHFPLDYWGARKRFASGDEKIILFVGRIVSEKGLDLVIRALPTLLHRGIPAKIVAVGEGPEKENYQRLAWNIGVGPKVHFAGHIDDEDLRTLYRVADVAVFPSRYEPFGIVALEAMAAGLPVVVSDVGGLAGIVDHEGTGLKVVPNNPGSIANAVERIVRDEGFRKWIVENAYKKCLENYDWDQIAEQTLGIYNRVFREWNAGDWKPK